MPQLTQTLDLPRCPHCAVARPYLGANHFLETRDSAGGNPRSWRIYICGSCGGVVTAYAPKGSQDVAGLFPNRTALADAIPDRARTYLEQARESLHAPAGAVMLAASAVDAMLKHLGLKDGSLYARIERAVNEHLITPEMGHWAHAVRLDANDQRHADDAAQLPAIDDASRSIDFATALAEILFVLPARVSRGLSGAGANQP